MGREARGVGRGARGLGLGDGSGGRGHVVVIMLMRMLMLMVGVVAVAVASSIHGCPHLKLLPLYLGISFFEKNFFDGHSLSLAPHAAMCSVHHPKVPPPNLLLNLTLRRQRRWWQRRRWRRWRRRLFGGDHDEGDRSTSDRVGSVGGSIGGVGWR